MGGVGLCFMGYVIWTAQREFNQAKQQQCQQVASSVSHAVQETVGQEIRVLSDYARFSLFVQKVMVSSSYCDKTADLLQCYNYLGERYPLVLLNHRGKTLMRSLSEPVFDYSQVVSVQGLLNDPNQRSLVEINQKDGCYYWRFAVSIFDDRGIQGVLVHEVPVDALEGLNRHLDALSQIQIQLCYEGKVVIKGQREVESQFVEVSLPVEGLTLRYAIDHFSASMIADHVIGQGVVLVAILMVIGVVVASIFGQQWLLQPLTLLRESAAQLASNQDGLRLCESQGVREVRWLAREFNRMADAVKSRTQQLQQLNDRMSQERNYAQRLFETAEVLMLVLDLDFRVIRINAKGERLLGYSKDDLLGKSWCEHFVPSDYRRVTREVLQTVMESPESAFEYFENPILPSDGQPRMIAWHNTALRDEQGRVEAILCSGEDVTDQQRAEEEQTKRLQRLRRHQHAIVELATLDRLPVMEFHEAAVIICATIAQAMEVDRVGIWLLEEKDTRMACQGLYVRKTRQTSQPSAWRSEDCPIFYQAVQLGQVMDVAEVSRDDRTRELYEDYWKTHQIASALIAPIRVDGQVVGVVCHEHVGQTRRWHSGEILFAGEVADQVAAVMLSRARLKAQEQSQLALQQVEQANDELKNMQSQLVQNEKLAAIGQLSAGVAHELNTPVGFVASNFQTLNGYVDKIRQLLHAYETFMKELVARNDEELTTSMQAIDALRKQLKIDFLLEDIGELFTESQEGLERVTSIVRNLRDFSRVDQAQQAVEFDINEGLRATLVVARNEIKYDADVEVDYGDIPPVPCHSGQINQVFLNILVNAAQAIKGQERSDHGMIRIKTFAVEEGVVCQISDNGPGMSPEVMNQIFNPFFTTKEPGKGTGLGMSVSYDIVVKKHQGQISVDSIPGEGTTFTIQLPFVCADVEGEPAMSESGV